MALFIRQDDERSQLQTKVTAELQERMKKTAQIEGDDVSRSSTALENQHNTHTGGIIAAVVLTLIVIGLLYVLWPK